MSKRKRELVPSLAGDEISTRACFSFLSLPNLRLSSHLSVIEPEAGLAPAAGYIWRRWERR